MTSFEILQATKLFLLDLDGTVYVDETPIGEMPKTLQTLRDMGKKLVFLTNNSSRTEAQYEEKLRRIGLFDERDGVYTSGTATVEYLKAHHAGERVFLLGTDALKEAFRAEGIVLECAFWRPIPTTCARLRTAPCPTWAPFSPCSSAPRGESPTPSSASRLARWATAS